MGFLVGRGIVVNKWNEVCRETAKRKIRVDLKILSVAAGGGRQSVGNKILTEQCWVGKRIRLRKYLKNRELLRKSLRVKSVKKSHFVNFWTPIYSRDVKRVAVRKIGPFNRKIYKVRAVIFPVRNSLSFFDLDRMTRGLTELAYG